MPHTEHLADIMMRNDQYRPSVSIPLHESAILVADDEPSIRELLQDILEPTGARVLLARSGPEALTVIETWHPDLAILDIRMPSPDGLDILRQLRAADNPMPIVIITAHDVADFSHEVMQSGASAYMTKPFDPDTVVAAVTRILTCSHI